MNLCQYQLKYYSDVLRCTQEINLQNFSHNLFDNINQKHLDLKYPSSFLLTLYNACVVLSFFVDRFEMLVTDPAMSVTNIDVELRPTSWFLKRIVPSTNCSILWTSWAESTKIFWNSSNFIQRDDNTIFSFSWI